jgi:hypothetical protein
MVTLRQILDRERQIGTPDSASHLLLLLGFCVFALAPLTAPGYFIYGHDARHSVYFLQMFDMSIQDGAWFPRWATDMVFGYGYPLWLILAPIPFYVGEAFHLIGMDFVSAVKMVDGLAFFFSALGMYVFAKELYGKNAALVAAIAYAYIPYHLVDLYVRSAQAELVGFVFPPFVFWAFYRLAATHNLRYGSFAALAYAGLLLSHIQTAVLFTPIIGLYLVLLIVTTRPPLADSGPQTADRIDPTADRKEPTADGREPTADRGQMTVAPDRGLSRDILAAAKSALSSERIRFAFYVMCSLALAIAIAAIFVLPILAERKYLTDEPLIGGFFNFRKHFLNASQLLSPFWGYGADQFSLQLGSIPTLLSVVCLFGWRNMTPVVRRHVVFFVLIVVAIIFALLAVSSPAWELFSSVVAYVQFPWRLLSIATFDLAVLTGAALHAFEGDDKNLVSALAVVAILVVASYPYTEPQHTEASFNYQTQMDFEVKDRQLLGDTVWMSGERPEDSPLVPQYFSGIPLEKAIALDEGASAKTLRHGGQSEDVQVDSAAGTRVMFYTRYFPGWTARIDDQPAALQPHGEQGLILVSVPAGSHVVRLRFEDTLIRQVGAVISAVSLVIALAIVWKWRVSFFANCARSAIIGE